LIDKTNVELDGRNGGLNRILEMIFGNVPKMNTKFCK